jgi:hypothetical protein
MNLDESLSAIVARVGRDEAISSVDIPPELAQPKSFLKVLRANHYNWESQRFRKLFAMRFSVKIPPLEQINSIFYPRDNYAHPVFIFFMLLTKRKTIVHLNLNCPFDDDEYRQEWVTPFTEILGQYTPFESDDRYPEWMQKYRTSSSIYGLFRRDRAEELADCCAKYLDLYMTKVNEQQPVTDPARLSQLQSFHAQWVDDLRLHDKAQGMMGKMIGKKTAHRIFYEVTT